MAKVIIEFNEQEDELQDINAVVNRHKLLCAVNELRDLYSRIYNDKIYEEDDVQIYLKSDGTKATEQDYKQANEKGIYLSGGKEYLAREWVEQQLNDILEDVKEFLY